MFVKIKTTNLNDLSILSLLFRSLIQYTRLLSCFKVMFHFNYYLNDFTGSLDCFIFFIRTYPSRTFGHLGLGISILDIWLPGTRNIHPGHLVTWDQEYPSWTFGYLGPGISIPDIWLAGIRNIHPGRLFTYDQEYPSRTFSYLGSGHIHPGHLVSWDQKYPSRTFVYLGPGHIHPGHNHDERKYELEKSKNREYTLHG